MKKTTTSPDQTLRQAVAHTSDAALLHIVQLLDNLSHRPGELDSILAAALPRLRALRPARPMRFNRLLFLPLEGAIASVESWDIGEGILPRRALTPILRVVRPALGELAEQMDLELRHSEPDDTVGIGAIGSAIWTEAAQVAPGLPVPPDQPFPAADFRALLDLCARVWHRAPDLWELLRHAPAPPPPEDLGRVLSAAGDDPEVVSVMVATLLHRAAAPGSLARLACTAAPELSALAEEALDRWIAGSVPDAILATPEAAADAASWFDAVTEDLDAAGWLGLATRRNRLDLLRQRITRARMPGPDVAAIQEKPERESADIGAPRELRGFAALRQKLFGR